MLDFSKTERYFWPRLLSDLAPGMPDANAAPTLHKLINLFDRDGGHYYELDPQKNDDPNASFTLANYQKEERPIIRLLLHAKDDIVIHELRHHQQKTKLLGKKFDPYSLHEQCRVQNLIEADARAVQALHFMEKIEHSRKNGNAFDRDVFRGIKYLQDCLGCPGIEAVFYEIYDTNKTDSFSREEKFRVMRFAFDAFVNLPPEKKPSYAKIQHDSVSKTYFVPMSFMIAMGLAPFMVLALPGDFLVGGSLALANLAQTAFMTRRKIKNTFNKCASPPASETAEIIKKLGESPDGSGNYMMQTKGPALDSDFYHALPADLEKLIAEKHVQLKQTLVPFSGTRNVLNRIFYGKPAPQT